MDGILSSLAFASVANSFPQMVHVWDHFDFTQNADWFKAQGWPLLKVGFLSLFPSSPDIS